MTDDHNQTWQQRDDENPLWYSRFLVYREMGVTRNVFASCKLWLRQQGKYDQAEGLKDVNGGWATKVREYEWHARAEAFDKDVCRKREAWEAEVLLKLRKQEVALGFDVLKEAKLMLDWPLQEKTVIEDDGTTVIFKPAGWTKATIERHLRVGTELVRAGCNATVKSAAELAVAGQGRKLDENDTFDEDLDWLSDQEPDLAAEFPDLFPKAPGSSKSKSPVKASAGSNGHVENGNGKAKGNGKLKGGNGKPKGGNGKH